MKQSKLYTIVGVIILIVISGIVFLPSQSQLACADGNCPDGFPSTTVKGYGCANQLGGQNNDWACYDNTLGMDIQYLAAIILSPLNPGDKAAIKKAAERRCKEDLEKKIDKKYDECKQICQVTAPTTPLPPPVCAPQFHSGYREECEAHCDTDNVLGVSIKGVPLPSFSYYWCEAKGSASVRCDCKEILEPKQEKCQEKEKSTTCTPNGG